MRTIRLAVLALVIGLSIWAGLQGGSALRAVSAQAPSLEGRGDIALYREVTRRVAAGESYYAAAAEQHRERNYPLKPFYTVRLPTLAWFAGHGGEAALLVAAWALLLTALAAWYRRMREHSFGERLAAIGLLTFTGAPLISEQAVMTHEFWCGMLLTAALAFDHRREWPAQLAFVALALAVREFAAAFLALMLVAAVVDQDKRRSVAVAAVAVVFGAGLWLHYEMVMSVVAPADPVSASWLGLRGPAGLVEDLRAFSWLQYAPPPLVVAVAFAPLLGWSTLRSGAVFALLWFLGFGLVIVAFARPDNLYWAVVLLPAYPIGLALLPGFVRDLLVRSEPPP